MESQAGTSFNSHVIFNTSVDNTVENELVGDISPWHTACSTSCTQLSALARKLFDMKKSAPKVRLDQLLLQRGMASSRERAQAMVIAGKVLVDGQKIVKSGTSVDSASDIRLLGEDLRYVSRGGLKLERALEHWNIDVSEKICLDVGASTGGFTDCLLQHGAASVIAVDTGQGQIAMQLRQDSRVRLLEKTNARYLTREQLGGVVDLIVVDVSFISATLVLPPVVGAAFPEESAEHTGCGLIVLVKPQFEAGRENVGKGGIVRDPEVHQQAVARVRSTVTELGVSFIDVIESPLLGAEGNREFLLYARF